MDEKDEFMRIVKPFSEICGVTDEELEELYLFLKENGEQITAMYNSRKLEN